MIENKNKQLLQTLKKYIVKQEHLIDLDILKTEILLLFKHEKEGRKR